MLRVDLYIAATVILTGLVMLLATWWAGRPSPSVMIGVHGGLIDVSDRNCDLCDRAGFHVHTLKHLRSEP